MDIKNATGSGGREPAHSARGGVAAVIFVVLAVGTIVDILVGVANLCRRFASAPALRLRAWAVRSVARGPHLSLVKVQRPRRNAPCARRCVFIYI